MSFLAKAALIVAMLLAPAAQARDGRAAEGANAGTISGRVEVETDRQRGPVRRAAITLTRNDGAATKTTGTDADGRYRFLGIAAGSYRLSARKSGFVAEPVHVSANIVGPGVVTANIEMQRAGAIEGRFVDSRGDPIAKLSVTADRWPMVPDDRTREPAHAAVTDDLGRFRVHTLPPGRYRVHATPPSPASTERLFYPGTTDPAEAQIVTVVSGQTLERLDFIVPVASPSPIAAEAMAAEAIAAERESVAAGRLARISGAVTRGDTGQAIPSAVVQILSGPGTTPSIRRHATTNSNGRFEFPGLASGSYELSATAHGFVASYTHGIARVIAVKAREGVDRADVVLTPASAVEVFVVDEFGDPTPGVVLQVAERRVASGVPIFFPVASPLWTTNSSDDRGWFRAAGLLPGDYYLLAIPEPFERSGPAGFATTYFPGVVSADAATPVHIEAGRDALDLRFGLVGARTATIAGVVTDLNGQPVPKAAVRLAPTYGGEVRAATIALISAGSDGRFIFPEVPEGTYVLQGGATGLFGSRAVSITPEPDRPLHTVALTLRPRITARGRIVFEGDPTPPRSAAAGSVLVSFQPTDFTSGPMGSNYRPSTILNNWSFEIADLAWHGVIRVTGLATPSAWTLSRVMLQGQNITDTPYDFQSADVNGLEVVVTSRVGAVAGTVVGGTQPATDAAVIVFGADNTAWTYFSRTLRGGITNAQGAFTIGGLLPGRYLAVAIPARNPPIDVNSVAALRSVATPFVVTEGATAPLTLTIVR